MLARLSAADVVGGRPLNYNFLQFVLTGDTLLMLTKVLFEGSRVFLDCLLLLRHRTRNNNEHLTFAFSYPNH
jgi:hypothetical protein